MLMKRLLESKFLQVFTLHLDKNNFLGAEGAFKLVLEAWILLTDKTERLEYLTR